MRTISKFLSILTVATGLAVLAPAVTFAASFWSIDMSIPATQYSRSFNVQYTALTTNSSDVIKVDLYQDGSKVATQTTIPGGDSGAFAVTVPNEGDHSFYLVATNGAETKNSDTEEIYVGSTPTVVNTINSGSSNSSANGTSGSGSAEDRANGTLNNPSGNSSGSNGQTNASGNSSTNKSNQTLGDSKSSTNDDQKKADEKAKNDRRNSIITWSIIGVLALAALAYGNRGRLAKLIKRSPEE